MDYAAAMTIRFAPLVLSAVVAAAACCLGFAPALAQPQPLPGSGPPPADGPPGGPRRPGRPDIDSIRSVLFVSPSGEPFRAGPSDPYPSKDWFRQADSNGDGRVDKAEFIADAERFFRQLDLDHDGGIDGVELQNYEHRVVPEILGQRLGMAGKAQILKAYLQMGSGGMGGGGMGGGGMGGGGRRGGQSGSDQGGKPARPQDDSMAGAAPYNWLAEPEPVAASDLSFAGKISLADFKRRAGQRFDRLDVDGRGYLTLDRLPMTAVQMRSELHRPRPAG
jgi:hypothetical protein